MPNDSNIRSPISLIAYGRSGTSVLSRAFQRHPDIDEVGETANCIFTPYRCVDQIEKITRFDDTRAAEAAADISRSALLRLFPSPKKRWFQKPIGIPRVFWEFGYNEKERFVDWYWNAYGNVFPQAKTFSVVRHPYDVFLSAREYWRYADDAIWPNLELMYILLHTGRQHVGNFYRYEDVVAHTEAALRHICDTVELDFRSEMLSAFGKLHAAPSSDESANDRLESAKMRGFSRKETWDNNIKTSASSEKTLQAYERLFEDISFVPLNEPL